MKKVILFLAFIFPIGIFIFLRYFGKNEFSIPVYYQTEEVISKPEGCTNETTIPYQVSESYLKSQGWNGESILIVTDTSRATRQSLTELKAELKSDKLAVVFVGADSSSTKLCRCEMIMKEPWTAALVDDERRIRGYYKPDTREEFDRLSVELKILLQIY